MAEELNDEQRQQGRAIIDSYLSADDIVKLREMLREDAPTSMSEEQKAAIRGLFKALGYL